MRMFEGWPLLLGLVMCSACKGEEQTASTSSDVPYCAESDGGRKVCFGCAVPTAHWADSGVLSCPRPVSEYCDQNANPVPPTTAPSCPPSDWSSLIASELASGYPPLFYACDAFDIGIPEWSCGSGASVLFVYDKASGELAASVEEKAGKETCLAGPSQFDYVSVALGNCTLYSCSPAAGGTCCHRADSSWDGGVCDFDAGPKP